MKDIIVKCKNIMEMANIINSIPINTDILPYSPEKLFDKAKDRYGTSASFRIENGAIHGYDSYHNYNNERYKRYYYEDFITETLAYRNANNLMNCVINTRTQEEADELIDALLSANSTLPSEWKRYWRDYYEDTIYVLVNGKLRFYGSASCEDKDIIPFADIKPLLPAIKMASENLSLYVRIKTVEQAAWLQKNIKDTGCTSVQNMWDTYGKNLVVRISEFKKVSSYRKSYDAVEDEIEARKDISSSTLLESEYRRRTFHNIFLGEEPGYSVDWEVIDPFALPVREEPREETAISFTKFKNMFTRFKTAGRKFSKTPNTKYIKCNDVFEARAVCNKYKSLIAPFSSVDWLKAWGKESRTIFKLVNNKIAGITTEAEVHDCGASVTRFNTVFSNKIANLKVCDYCGHTAESGIVNSKGEIICQECLKDFARCECCGELERITDMNTCDDIKLCSSCYENNTRECSDCGERHLLSNVYTDSNGTALCSDCRNNYYLCDRCNTFVLRDDALYSDGFTYCTSCYDIALRENAIRDYYYKPEPQFYGATNSNGKRFFGVELEVDECEEDSYNAYDVLKVANANADHIYIKHDGSLNDGFEVVSHPMTLDYHMSEMPWKDTMGKLINLGYYSHQTDTCGLHVHVNRSSLGGTESQQDETIAKILYFIEQHWNEVVKFTRRVKGNLDRWAGRYGYETEPKKILDKAKCTGNRYCAVNLRNQHTIEFRIFRGTLKYNTFIATLQFVNKVCELAMFKTEEQIMAMSWFDFVETVTEPELIQYLKERKLYVNEEVNTEEDI